MGEQTLFLIFAAVNCAVWTAVLVRRVLFERKQVRTWTRLVALDFMLWAITIAYLATALAVDDVGVRRMIGGAAFMGLLVVGVALLLMRPRQMR